MSQQVLSSRAAVAEIGDRLAAIDMGRKRGHAMPLSGGGSWVPMQHNVAWAEVYLRTKWHLDPSSRLTATDMGRKLWAVPLWGDWINTMSPGPRPTSVPSGILIHPTVWPQYTNVTDRTDITDRTGQTNNGPVAQSESFY